MVTHAVKAVEVTHLGALADGYTSTATKNEFNYLEATDNIMVAICSASGISSCHYYPQ